MRNSELTFEELSKELNYTQVWWNKKKVFDDYDGDSSIEELRSFEEKYGNKIVYSMFIEVVEFHHCILKVEGEK